MKKYLQNLLFATAIIIISVLPAVAGRYKAHNDYMLATVLWHEIRGGSDYEIKQVANVIMNRLDMFEQGNKEGYQLELGDILTARAQFSGSEKYLNARMTDADILKHINMRGSEGTAWKVCLNIAQQALAGQLPDLTHGATHYRTCLGPNMTFWGASKIQGVSHGKHCFFKGISMGAMKVNGHTFKQGKVTGKYSKGGAYVDNGGDGSGEGSGYLGGGDSYGSGGFSGYDNGGFLDLTFNDAEYTAMCEQAKTETDASTTPPNLFNTKILTRITEMMEKVYVSLGELYAVGQSLMCFATGPGKIKLLVFHLVNVPYWFAGIAIYLAAFFITMGVGLFFVDAVFKIGFALLLLPISIALWPFKPTSGKLSENFSIIIRNSMLFALVGMGIGFAVVLIQNAVLHGINELEFEKALSDGNVKSMAKQFALSGTNFLIIIFCLIYGFKIIQSSVNDYLNRIFPDNVFGGQSPMHQSGVQALGNMGTHAVMPVAALAGDIALNQAGRGIEAMGRGLKNYGSSSSATPTRPTPAPVGSDGGGSGPTSPMPTNNFEADNAPIAENEGFEPTDEATNNEQTPITPTQNANNRQNPEDMNNRRQPNTDNRRRNQGQQPTSTQTPQSINPNNANSYNRQDIGASNPQQPPQSFTGGANPTPQTQKYTGFAGAMAAGMALGQQDQVEGLSLSPGNLLRNTANATLNILTAPLNKKTYQQLQKLPEIMEKRAKATTMHQNQREMQENNMMPDATNGQRIIMRLSRDATLFVRTAKQTASNTIKDTTKETAYAAGSLLEKFGARIRPTKRSHLSQYWQQYNKKREDARTEEIQRQKDQRETDSTLADDYVDRGGNQNG